MQSERWRITQEEYDNHRKNWRSKQEEYRDKLGKLQQADEQYYITASLLLQLATRSKELFLSSEPDEKREIVQLIFQNLSLNQGNLEYTMNKPFDSIFKTGGSLKWGSQRGSNPRHPVPQTGALPTEL
jgi:hypothetical protein